MTNLNEKLIADFHAHSINASVTDDGLSLIVPVDESKGFMSKVSLLDISEALQEVSYEEVFNSILSQVTEARQQLTGMNLSSFDPGASYEDVKDDLIVRPLNFERHKTKIERGVYKTIGDIALVLYRLIADTETNLMSHMVTRSELENWGIPEEKYDAVLEAALANTSVKYPASIIDASNENCRRILDEDMTAEEILGRRQMTLVSTERGTNGAAAMFYPGVAQKLVRVFGPFKVVFMNTTDAIVFPSSVDRATLERYRDFGCEDNEFGESISQKIFDCTENGVEPEAA